MLFPLREEIGGNHPPRKVDIVGGNMHLYIFLAVLSQTGLYVEAPSFEFKATL